MKSVNRLQISGTVISISDPVPGKTFTRFTLVHNFGGIKTRPLFLSCLHPAANAVRLNEHIVVDAYLKMAGPGASAFIKRITRTDQ